jgi:sugar lactone lactonase YvrE
MCATGRVIRNFIVLHRKPLGFLFLFSNLLCCIAQGQATFPLTAVGHTSSAATVSVIMAGTGIAAAPTADTQHVLQGEFSVSPGGSCIAGMSVLVGQQCTVQVAFTPSAPGLRQGVVRIVDTNGKLLGQAMLTGIGKGPLPVLDPGDIDTVSGDGEWIYRGDGALATFSPIFLPTGVVVDAAGNIYLSDSNNNRIRRVDAVSGTMSTVAGSGALGFAGDGGPAVQAMVSTPAGLTMDGAGNIYFADTGNQAIRRIDALTGTITTVAGQGGVEGYEGDGGPATAAQLSFPEAVVFDVTGNMYISDTGNNVVRVVSKSGIITTFAGTGIPGFNGDGIAAQTAELNGPWGLAAAVDGSLYIADLTNNRVRRVDTAGVISTVAGTGGGLFGGDGGPATTALIKAPAAVVLDAAGNLYIADSGNNRVRKVSALTGKITTVSGADSEEFGGDKGPAVAATMYGPYALHLDTGGNLFVADLFHNRIREIYAMHITEMYPTMRVGKTSAPVPVSLANAGNADLQVSQFVENNAALDPATTTCTLSTTLNAGNDCILGAEFAPTVVGDPVPGSIVVNNSGQPTPQSPAPTINLSGTVLSVNPTAVALTANVNPIPAGATVTFSATVSGSATLTGTVAFLDGTTQLCNVTLTGLSASCAVSTLALGSHNITAAYSGDDQDAACTSAVLIEVVKQLPDYLMTVAPNPAVVGSAITLTFTAPVLTAGAQPVTGSIVFYDGTTVLGNAPLQNGVAVLTTTSLSVGTHSLVGVAAGDAQNLGGTSNVIPEVVQPQATTTLLSLSSADTTVGTMVTFSATVSNSGGAMPTGSVQFNDGAISLGSVAVNASGTAILTTSALAPGTHSIMAQYIGDANDQASQSAALTQTVRQISTTTTLAASANTVNAGSTLKLTALVSPGTSVNGSLSGTVTFIEGANTLGAIALDANGAAVLNVNTLGIGTHSILATYNGNTNYAISSSAALQIVVQITGTATALSSSSTSTLAGQPVRLSVAVTSSTATPTGTVTIYDGTAAVGTVTLSAQGTAVFATSNLSIASHTLTAVYAGDAQYSPSTSAALQQTVSLATTALTIAAPTVPVNAGLTFSVTCGLTSNGVTPSGTVTLLDNGKPIATQTAAATVTFAGLGLSVGSHTLTAAYAGDANNAAASSATVVVIVQQGASTVTLTASANPVLLGQNIMFTATANSVSPNVTGTMTFMDGATPLVTVPVNASGVATYSTSTLVLGPHTITASYGGDTSHAASNPASLSELIVQASTVVAGSSSNPSVSGNMVTISAKVTGAGAIVPTGSLTFTDGAVLLGIAAIDPTGSASVQVATLAVGSHAISVNYPGDNYYYAATGSLIQTVQSATTQVTLNSSANPAIYGKPVSFTATITSNGGVATGGVGFTLDGKLLASALLNTSGVATLTTSSLTPGSHTIVATYAGDGKAGAASSVPLSESVLEATVVALVSSANPAQTLAPVVLTATVTNSQVGTPTGTIIFSDGAAQLGTAQLDATGRASLPLPHMAAGTHAIVASYGGDSENFAANSPNLSQTVYLQSTSTTLTGAANDPTNAQSVLLIAVVHTAGSTIPTGTITFSEGTQVLGSAAVDASGVATLPVMVQPGTNSITATYSGDAAYASSTSQATNISAGAATQFAMALSPSTLTMQTKQHGTSTLTVTAVGSYTDTMEFGCLGLPFAATCTFSKSTDVLKTGGSLNVQVTVDTGNPLGAGAVAQRTILSNTLLCMLPAGLLLGFRLRRKRRLITLAMMALVTMGMVFATGCAGLQINGTPAGSYSFKVTASGQGTGVTQSQVMTLTVTQ